MEKKIATTEYVNEQNKKSYCMITTTVDRKYTYQSSALLTIFDSAVLINNGLVKNNNYIEVKKDMNLVSFKVFIRCSGNTNVYIRHVRGSDSVKQYVKTTIGEYNLFFDICFDDVKTGDYFYIMTYVNNMQRTVYNDSYISVTEL